MLLMRDNDGQLMTCQREDVSLDPAGEVQGEPAPIPAFCVGGGCRVGLSTAKRHSISTCANHGFCDHEFMTSWSSSLWYKKRSRDDWELTRLAMCLTVLLLSEFSEGRYGSAE